VVKNFEYLLLYVYVSCGRVSLLLELFVSSNGGRRRGAGTGTQSPKNGGRECESEQLNQESIACKRALLDGACVRKKSMEFRI